MLEARKLGRVDVEKEKVALPRLLGLPSAWSYSVAGDDVT